MQSMDIDWTRAFARTGRALTTLTLATAVSIGAYAGGQNEEPTDPSTEQDQGTPIIIEEGNRVDGAEQEESEDGEGEARDGAPEDSERPIWALVEHPQDEKIVENVSGVIDDGYTPVGMDVGDGRISMLYASSDRVLFNRWVIHEFTDLAALNDEFSQFLLNEWIPMDISVRDSEDSWMAHSRDRRGRA